MKLTKLARLLAVFLSLALVAAACGSDGVADTVSGAADAVTEAAEDAGDAASDTAEEVTSDDDAMDGDAMDDDAMDDDAMDDDAMDDDAMGDMLADDSVFGNGASQWEAAVAAGTANPIEADGEPIDLFMVNLEGSPGGSFPEVREGMEIGLRYINENLGGVNGRPLEMETCAHTLDPAEAQACATESASSGSHIIIKGIDFFSAVLWPVWGTEQPVIDTLPIFVADFTAPNSLAMGGGCVVAFPGAAQMMVEQLNHDKIAIIYSDNGPGQECYKDTQERFYQYYADQGLIEFRGFPDAPFDASDNDANVQEVLNYLEDAEKGAVHFGIAAANCAEYNDALDAAGNTNAVYNSGSCVDDAVQEAASATGKYFGFTGPPSPSNAALLAQFPEFWQWEVNHREEVLVAGDPESPLSTFMRLGFNTAVMAYQVTNDFDASGGDIDDRAALLNYMQNLDNQHRVGGLPLDCANKVADWAAVCDFTQVYYEWDGNEFVAFDDLPSEPFDPSTWTKVQPLLEKVAQEVPRDSG